MWHFVYEGRVDVYLQRVWNMSNMAHGLNFLECEEQAKGIPTIILSRTYPKIVDLGTGLRRQAVVHAHRSHRAVSR